MTSKKQIPQKQQKNTTEKLQQQRIKLFGIEGPPPVVLGIVIGIIVGVILSVEFIAKYPNLFLKPLIVYAVKETVSAQALSPGISPSQSETLKPMAILTPTTTTMSTEALTLSPLA